MVKPSIKKIKVTEVSLFWFYTLVIIFCFWFIYSENVLAKNEGSLDVSGQMHTEHVIWERQPIEFIVPTNQERIITFPGPVELHNLSQDLTTDKVSILNNDGSLYIKAKKAFDPIRVAISLKTTGQVILIDISSKTGADNLPLEVLFLKKESKDTGEGIKKCEGGTTASINYTLLMRYAIQHLYSPERLIEDNPSINRTPMFTTKSVSLVYGSSILTMPLTSWRGGDLYVTAVLLKNTLCERIHLSPLKLKGQWLAATFYPTNFLTKKGTLHDRTTLFLVSDRPFNESLEAMRGYR